MTKNKFEDKKVNSFDKSYFANINFKKPHKYKDIENCSSVSGNLITSGSYYNYTPASFHKNSISIDLSKFNRIINFDKSNKEITVEAGIKLYEFLNLVLKENLWIPQLPGYPFITLGGAVAANVHGKSCGSHGTIRNSIKKILLFHKTNGWMELSNEKNKEIFDLTIGGLGLTGTIVNVTLKLSAIENLTFVTTKKKISSFSECINFIKENSSENTYIYSWNRADSAKNLSEGFVFKNQVTRDKKDINFKNLKFNKKSFFNFPICLWNKTTIKLVNSIYFNLLNSKKNSSFEKFEQVIFPFYGKEIYFNLFGKKGFIESQLLIDEKNLLSFFDEFNHLYKIHSPLITLFSIKNMSGEQKLIRFEDNRMCVTFDFVNNKKNKIFLTELDKLCVKYHVIPSIIKDSRLPKEIFVRCYNEVEEFRDKLLKFDKKRVYKSKLSERFNI